MVAAVMLRTRGNFYHLVYAYDNSNSVELISWAARNLVELAVWAKYVTASEENWKTMWLDQLIDADEFARSVADFIRLHTGDGEILRQLDPFLAAAKKARADNGLADTQRYKSVASAAADVGHTSEYKALNKLLSKLVHPTALSIMLVMDNEGQQGLKNWVTSLGINYAHDALTTIIEFFRAKGIDVSVVDRAASA